jgi:hypothetical protein
MTKINVYCSGSGWLFGDFKRFYSRTPFKGASIVCTDHPLPATEADVWICIRSNELSKSPDLSRTVVQRHDMFAQSPETYRCMAQAADIIYGDAAYRQLDISLGNDGERFMYAAVLPIGVRKQFVESATTSTALGHVVGIGGREYLREGVELKRSTLINDALMLMATQGAGIDILKVFGSFPVSIRLAASVGKVERAESTPSSYDELSCFVTASVSPAIPLGMFEAAARGIPIASTFRCAPDWMQPLVSWASPLPSMLARSTEHALRVVRAIPNPNAVPRQEDWLSFSVEAALDTALDMRNRGSEK